MYEKDPPSVPYDSGEMDLLLLFTKRVQFKGVTFSCESKNGADELLRSYLKARLHLASNIKIQIDRWHRNNLFGLRQLSTRLEHLGRVLLCTLIARKI